MSAPTEIDFLIIDAFSLLFRAYHSFPLSLTAPNGELTNAVYGFTRLLLDAIRRWQPRYVVVATDMGKPTFRHQEYTAYKANREEAPHELTSQIGKMYEVLTALNIPTLGVEGYEADDVIGTLSRVVPQQSPDLHIGIFTGDRDAFQLVNEYVSVLLPPRQQKTGIQLVDSDGVREHFGIAPDQVVDYKALCGDSSDNIPGVRGIGPKTAQQLILQFGHVPALYERIDEVAQSFSASVVRKLAEGQEEAMLSLRLATIDTQVPIPFTLSDAEVERYDKATAQRVFDQFGFHSLKSALPADHYETAVQASLFGGV